MWATAPGPGVSRLWIPVKLSRLLTLSFVSITFDSAGNRLLAVRLFAVGGFYARAVNDCDTNLRV